MKLLALLGSGSILVLGMAQQTQFPTIPEPLSTNLTKLADAKSFKAHFTKRLVGEPGKAFDLEMSKDKKFKLTSDDGFVLSDGTNVYVYKKASNQYTQTPVTDKEMEKFGRRIEVMGWEAFFQPKPGSDIVGAVKGADKTVQGQQVQTVDVTLKPDNRTATFFINPSFGLTTGFSMKQKDKEYLVMAEKVEITSEALPDKEFAFVAPEGAMLMKEDDATFASVQQLMTDRCMPCHSSDHKRAGVDLSSYDGVLAAVKPGNSAGSLLVKSLKGDGVEMMPKGRAPLSSDEISMVAKWIDAGAKNE